MAGNQSSARDDIYSTWKRLAGQIMTLAGTILCYQSQATDYLQNFTYVDYLYSQATQQNGVVCCAANVPIFLLVVGVHT